MLAASIEMTAWEEKIQTVILFRRSLGLAYLLEPLRKLLSAAITTPIATARPKIFSIITLPVSVPVTRADTNSVTIMKRVALKFPLGSDFLTTHLGYPL